MIFNNVLMYMTEGPTDEVMLQTALKQLRGVFGANTEQIVSGLEGLKRAEAALDRFDALFSEIKSVCSESTIVIEADDTLRRLAMMHSNMTETLRNTETVAGLPEAAARAERMLQDRNSSSGLIDAHLYLSQVEATVYRIKNTLETLQHQQNQPLPSLETYFRQVHNAMSRIEHRLWSVMRSFVSAASSRPTTLVAALRVIETQELVDAALLSDGLGDCPLRKGWRRRCIDNMKVSISESFSDVLQRCSKLLSSESDSGILLRNILGETSDKLLTAHGSMPRLVPCFPKIYRIEDFIWKEFKMQVDNILEVIGAISGQLSNSDILFAMDWIQSHRRFLYEDTSSIEDVLGVDSLLQTYVNRMDNALRNWLRNIMNSDFEAEPRVDASGRLFTPGPQDMFRLIEEQITVAQKGGDALLERVVIAIEQMINDYALEYKRRIAEESHPLEILCAVGNNCLRNCDLVSHLNQTIDAILPSDSTARQEQHFTTRFQYVGKQAAEMCGQVVFMDPGFGELFSLLCNSEDWKSGDTSGSMLATFDDFLSDFRTWLDEYLLNIVATSMLIECVSYYLGAVLSQLRYVNTDTLSCLKRDGEGIKDYFKRYLSSDVVENECQVLFDLFDFLASDSTDSFVLSYTSLLEHAPVTPTLLLGVLNARVASQHDMTKADAKEVMAACREAFENAKSSFKGGNSSFGLNPAIKNPSYIAALNAVRRRY